MSENINSNNFYFSSSFDEIEEIAKYLKANTKYRPKIGIVCGTGLGTLVNAVEKQDVFPYEKIPNFPRSTGFDTFSQFEFFSWTNR